MPVEHAFTDYIQAYYLLQDGTNVSFYATGRYQAAPYKCASRKRELRSTEIPGRFELLASESNTTRKAYQDFIFVSTDYETYSVVYVCGEKLPNGDCVASVAAIFSRTSLLSPDKIAFAESIVSTLCLDVSTLIDVPQTNPCPIDKDCAIYTIDKMVQRNFNAHKFAGKWFVTRYLPGQTAAVIGWNTSYQLNFVPDNQGSTIKVYPRGRKDDGSCVYFQGELQPAADNGKFAYKCSLNNICHETNLWVMSTDDDYEHYAVWYGCQQTDATGICTYQISLVLSRSSVSSEAQQALINLKLQELCLDTSNFVQIDNSNPCPDQAPSKGAVIQKGLTMLMIMILVVI